MGKAHLVALGSAIAGVSAVAIYFAATRPTSYSECMVKEGRGLEKPMLEHVSGMCERSFPFEKEIEGDSKTQIQFAIDRGPHGVRFNVSKNRSEYRVTKVRGAYSSLECEDSDIYRYTVPLLVEFDASGRIGKPNLDLKDRSVECFVAKKVYGIRDHTPE